MLYMAEPILIPTEMDPLELYSTNELMNELAGRFSGFIFAGYTLPRCRGDYSPQVYCDTDLESLSEIQKIGNKFFADMAEEMEE